MLKNTRCALKFSDSENILSGDCVAKLLSKWAILADLVEKKLEFNEIIVWSLVVVGGRDLEPAKSHHPKLNPRIFACIELCREEHFPSGAYLIHSSSSTYQGTLVVISQTEAIITEKGFHQKFGEQIEENEMSSIVARSLRR